MVRNIHWLLLLSFYTVCCSETSSNTDVYSAENQQVDAPLICGDDLCHPSEDAVNCPQDCSFCGDQICSGSEDDFNCAVDCSNQRTMMTGGVEQTIQPNTQDMNGGTEQGTGGAQDIEGSNTGGLPLPEDHHITCGNQTCDMNESVAICPADCAPNEPQPDPSELLLGWVDSLQLRDGQWMVSGWACHRGWPPSIAIDIYADGDMNTGTFLRREIPQEEQEDAVDRACNIVNGRHRFRIPFTEEELSEYAGQEIHVYAVSPVRNESQALNQSGDFTLPLALPDGMSVDDMTSDDMLPEELSEIRWLHTNVLSWPVTTMLSVTLEGGTICMEYDKKNVWPPVEIPHSSGDRNIDVVANPWVFFEYQGQWYAGTWEWLAVGSTCKNQSSVAGDHIKRPEFIPLDWRPISGQRLYIMVSALARFSQISNVQERSQIVEVTWP